MTKKDMTPEMTAMLENLNKRLGKNHGNAVLATLGDRTKSDPSSAQFAIGDTLYVNDDVNNLFAQTFNGRVTTGVTVACTNAAGKNSAKALYFSCLDRSIPEYGSDLQPTGNVEYAKTADAHDVFDTINGCATEADVYNALKGRTLEVAAINSVVGARYNAAGQVVGTRTRNIPVFTFK